MTHEKCPVATIAEEFGRLIPGLDREVAAHHEGREREGGASRLFVADLISDRMGGLAVSAMTRRAHSTLGAAFQVLLAIDRLGGLAADEGSGVARESCDDVIRQCETALRSVLDFLQADGAALPSSIVDHFISTGTNPHDLIEQALAA